MADPKKPEGAAAAPSAGTAPGTDRKPTHAEKMALKEPEEGKVNLFKEPNGLKIVGTSFVHGFYKNEYVDLRNIELEKAQLLAADTAFGWLVKA